MLTCVYSTSPYVEAMEERELNSRMRTYADSRMRMRTYAGMLTRELNSRMRTYAASELNSHNTLLATSACCLELLATSA